MLAWKDFHVHKFAFGILIAEFNKLISPKFTVHHKGQKTRKPGTIQKPGPFLILAVTTFLADLKRLRDQKGFRLFMLADNLAVFPRVFIYIQQACPVGIIRIKSFQSGLHEVIHFHIDPCGALAFQKGRLALSVYAELGRYFVCNSFYIHFELYLDDVYTGYGSAERIMASPRTGNPPERCPGFAGGIQNRNERTVVLAGCDPVDFFQHVFVV